MESIHKNNKKFFNELAETRRPRVSIKMPHRSILERVGIKRPRSAEELTLRKYLLDPQHTVPVSSSVGEGSSKLPAAVESKVQGAAVPAWQKTEALFAGVMASLSPEEKKSFETSERGIVELKNRGKVGVTLKRMGKDTDVWLRYKKEQISISSYQANQSEVSNVLVAYSHNVEDDHYMMYDFEHDAAADALTFTARSCLRGRGFSVVDNASNAINTLQALEGVTEDFAARAGITLPSPAAR